MGKKSKQRSVAASSQGPKSGSFRYWPHATVLLIIVLFGLIRVRLLDIPLERDEGEYAYAGQLILQGIPPYQLSYNMKLPGTYAAYALILGILGQTPSGIHVGLLLANAATTFLMFLLAARMFGPLAGVVSAASFAVLSTSPSVLGMAGHATHFVTLGAVAGTLILLRAIDTKRAWLYFWSGILLGLAFLMKQPGIFFVLFAGVYLLSTELKRQSNSQPLESKALDSQSPDWRGFARRSSLLGLGAVLPFGLACLILWRAGVFSKFWFWTFVYAREYGSALNVLSGSHVLWMMAPIAIGPGVFIWLIASVGLSAIVWDEEARNHRIFLAAFLLFSFLAVCPGFYFRQHYFIVMLPAVSLLAGVGVAAATRKFQESSQTRAWRFLPVLVFAIAFAWPLVRQRDFLFQMDPLTANRALYAPNPFPEALRIADYIKSNTSPDARIAILGSEPEIYFYAHRHSATGYIYVYPLMEPHQYAATMQQEMISEIEKAQPEFIVVVNVEPSWVVRPESDTRIFAWAQKYLPTYYVLDGIADILQTTEYRWGDEARAYHPTSPYTVEVFKRRTP